MIITFPLFSLCVLCRTTRWLSTAANVAKISAVAGNKDHMTQRRTSDRQLPSVQFPTDCLALNFRFSFTTRNHATARRKKSKENKRKKRGEEHKREPSLFFTNHYFKNKRNLFVHRILHVLLNYSYIAILYSICQCTVQKCLSKKKREKISMTRWDSTSCVKEKQGATESVGKL